MLSDPAALSPAEITRLTLFKWRYMCLAYGFKGADVPRLVFARWLVWQGKLGQDDQAPSAGAA